MGYSHALSLPFLLSCQLPAALTTCIIFFWIFMALARSTEQLNEKQETEPLMCYQRMRTVLVFTLVGATLSLFFQVFDFMSNNDFWWKFYWLSTDGSRQILFLIVLVAMMQLWAPHENSWVPPAPTSTSYVGVDGVEGSATAVAADEEEEEGLVADGDVKGTNVAPEEIGARAEDEDEDGTMLL